jgi:hypothetical protein
VVLEGLGVTDVVRLNAAEYERGGFVARGIAHHDLAFDDGAAPPDAVRVVCAFFAARAVPPCGRAPPPCGRFQVVTEACGRFRPSSFREATRPRWAAGPRAFPASAIAAAEP